MLPAVTAYARTRWNHGVLRTREAVEAHQRRGVAATLAHARRRAAFYRDLPADLPVDGPPVVDKAIQQARFEAFNVPQITRSEVDAALADGSARVRGYPVGRSTGTSGSYARFVISDRERFTWLGTILAKALPDAPWRRRRVALALPGMISLYRSAEESRRVALRFFDLAQGVDAWLEDFVRYAPDTLVAPARVLRWLAEQGALHGVECFSAGEVLDPLDRATIAAASGRTVREIYMATEGLLAVSCREGVLHMAEDVIRCEWEPMPDSRLSGLVFTDMVRRVQPMMRYRMNDLLELDPRPCACGLAFQPVRGVAGRTDDCLFLTGADGQARMVTPDVVRNAIVGADPGIGDFRAVQTGPAALVIHLPASTPRSVDAVVGRALQRAFEPFGSPEVTIDIRRGITTPADGKLRRVRREAF